MAAGVAVVTVNKVESSGDRVHATGTLHLSDDYQTGGDTVADALNFGMAVVEDLFFGLPQNATGAAITAIFFPVLRTVLPVRTAKFGGSAGPILIQAFTATSTEESGDLSAYIIPWEAWGIGG